jgi:hypothetical protein
MTEELLQLYKFLYGKGVFYYKLPKGDQLNITCSPRSKLYSQHQFPEYEYDKKYLKQILKKLE